MILLLIAAAWLSGSALGALGYGSWWPAFVLGGSGLALGWVLTGRRAPALLAGVALVSGLLSLARYEAALPSEMASGIALYNDSASVRLLGTVSTEPEAGETTQRFAVDVEAIEREGDWQRIEGRVLVTLRLFPTYEYGDIMELSAELETPPVFASFDYREYLARRGIVSTALFPATNVLGNKGGLDPKAWLIKARTPFGEALARSLPEPESALARGILLGQRASIPDDVDEAFNAAGISHLIAISGYNVMLVVGAVIATLTPFAGRRRAIVTSMAVVVVFAVFVGGSPPVLRAMLMALVMLGATLVGRPGSALTGVALAGAVLVAVRPLAIEDVSFQLSFAATLGIVMLATPLREWMLGLLYARVPDAVASMLADSLAVTTAASIAVLPIIASTFGRLSVVSLPANVLAGPIFIVALLGSFTTAAAGVIDEGLGRTAGEVAYLPLHYLVVLAEVASSLPVASVSISGFGIAGAAILYLVAGGLAMLLGRRQEDVLSSGSLPRVGPAPALAVASLIAVSAMLWSALQPDDDHLRVWVLDVGQGDAILVEAPSGTRVLVDGGPSGALLSQAMGDVLAPGERSIDLMVLTHAQDDHVTGLIEALQRYDVASVLWNGVPGDSGAYREWQRSVSERGLPMSLARAGQVIDLGDGAFMEVLHPQAGLLEGTEDDLNNNAVVLRLVYGEVSFLLTGDIEVDGEEAILDAGHDVSATVLKVAHHGSDGATTASFLDAVSPRFAVVSAGEGNSFGHPSPSLRLRLAGIPLLRTDTNGTVTFETDGMQLWLERERGEAELVEPLGAR